MFQGQSVWVRELDEPGVFELCFDREGDAINKLDARTITEFGQATQQLAAEPALKGVLVTSAKDVFIVGADITEFGQKFQLPAEVITADVLLSNSTLNQFEDLPVPTVCAINGFALGGGLELAMASSLRVMANSAKVGVPEVKLGLFPGFGGTVRLSRLVGPAVACDWVSSGQPQSAETALAVGVVNEAVALEDLRNAAMILLRRAMAGDVD